MPDEIDRLATGGWHVAAGLVTADPLKVIEGMATVLGLETNGGALTVVWAEENSRDAIFTALKNRETYATSGTRPIVRFFAGFDLPADICERGDFAAQG